MTFSIASSSGAGTVTAPANSSAIGPLSRYEGKRMVVYPPACVVCAMLVRFEIGGSV